MLARHSGKETIELGEYLSEMVLFNRECLGLHTSISIPPPCNSVDCTAPCAVDRIDFAWPPVLTVESDIRSSSKPLTKENTVVSFPTLFKIADSQDSEVTYRLSGRVMHQPTMNHFTATLSHGDSVYLLDDMKGTLRKSTSSNPWKRSGSEVYWVYVRTSQASKVCMIIHLSNFLHLNLATIRPRKVQHRC